MYPYVIQQSKARLHTSHSSLKQREKAKKHDISTPLGPQRSHPEWTHEVRGRFGVRAPCSRSLFGTQGPELGGPQPAPTPLQRSPLTFLRHGLEVAPEALGPRGQAEGQQHDVGRGHQVEGVGHRVTHPVGVTRGHQGSTGIVQ